MTDKKNVQEYLAYYGADITTWPDHARALGQLALQTPEWNALVESEKRFEALLADRHLAFASADMASRIIAVAQSRSNGFLSSNRLFGLRLNVPSAAIAAMLLLGCAVGVGALAPLPTSSDQAAEQAFSEDESTL